MVRQQLRLRRADRTIVKFLQRGCDALVANLTPALEQAGVSHIARESMVERINGVGRRCRVGRPVPRRSARRALAQAASPTVTPPQRATHAEIPGRSPRRSALPAWLTAAGRAAPSVSLQRARNGERQRGMGSADVSSTALVSSSMNSGTPSVCVTIRSRSSRVSTRSAVTCAASTSECLRFSRLSAIRLTPARPIQAA